MEDILTRPRIESWSHGNLGDRQALAVQPRVNTMKAYVLTTGALFGLITIAHVWRMVEEPPLATAPWYILITAAAAALGLWAVLLLRRRAS
jgi:uncharacterized membrane protein